MYVYVEIEKYDIWNPVFNYNQMICTRKADWLENSEKKIGRKKTNMFCF